MSAEMSAGLHWLEEARSRYTGQPGASLVFVHVGTLDRAALERLVVIAERASEENGDPTGLRKRLVNVLVEGLENLHRHPHNGLGSTSMALLVEGERGYHFAMGNALPNATAALLTHRVGILNEMDEDDLRDHYLKFLSNEARSANGGAGLGLFTMARKCDRPIIVRSQVIDPALAYLSIELTIGRNGTDQMHESPE